MNVLLVLSGFNGVLLSEKSSLIVEATITTLFL